MNIICNGIEYNCETFAYSLFLDILDTHLANLECGEDMSAEDIYDMLTAAIASLVFNKARNGEMNGRDAYFVGQSANGFVYEMFKQDLG